MERLTQQLIDALTTEHRVVVIGPPGCAPFLPAGVEVHACRRNGAAGFLIEAAWRTLCLCARRQWLSTVIATSGLSAPLAWLGARLQRRPYLTIVHGLDLVTPAVLYRWVFLPAIRAAATVVANSANTATLARLAGVPATRIVIVHPGVEWPLSLPPAEAFRLRHGLGSRPLLLALGRLVARKGLPEFIACALAAIVDAVPEVMLVIIGDEPHQAIRREQSVMPRLRAAIAERGLSGHVLLRGRADDDEVREACVAAQAFVFPLIPVAGDVEGFGMVAVEAAACGLPTVAFDEGGVADALVPGVTGTLLPSGDYAGMVAALVAELNRADTSARRAACRAAARRFDWPHYRARILAVLARHLRDEEERDMAVDDEQQRELSAIREFYDGAYYRDLPPRLVASGHHERLAARLGVSAGQQVLDVACGTGAWLASCERRVPELKRVGVELMKSKLESTL